MKRDYFISVAIATFNGEKYIQEQLESILIQLEENDEIIISDDESIDDTLEIINSFHDNRIKLIKGPKNGIKQNFANAIQNCNGKYIFLSDQDDIWEKDKVSTVLTIFEKNDKCSCVIHDCKVFDANIESIIYNSFFQYRNSGKGIFKNIMKNTYIGCCMAFDSNLKRKILPIPNSIEMHDQWTGLLCEKYGKSIFIADKLIKYRRHETNSSSFQHYGIMKMLKNRMELFFALIKRL